jgi:hypothetical protein
MPFVECPHCYTRVLAAATGQCPACGKNTTDPRLGSAVPRTKATIREGTRLPAICYHCGAPTDRMTTVRRGWKGSGDSWVVEAMALLAMVLAPFWALLWWLSRRPKPHSMRVRLPQCVPCSRVSAPIVEHTDFAAGEITLLVHKDFRTAMAARAPMSMR